MQQLDCQKLERSQVGFDFNLWSTLLTNRHQASNVEDEKLFRTLWSSVQVELLCFPVYADFDLSEVWKSSRESWSMLPTSQQHIFFFFLEIKFCCCWYTMLNCDIWCLELHVAFRSFGNDQLASALVTYFCVIVFFCFGKSSRLLYGASDQK